MKDTYVKLFMHINQLCFEHGFIFFPETFVIDFEQAIHSTVEEVWPTEIRGCNFHLAQSWYRKIQELGLAVEYNEGKSDVGKFLNYIFGLPYLLEEEIEDCFVFDFMSIKPDDDKVQEFCDYMIDNYVPEDAKFPPTVWAGLNEEFCVETTNACESFHAHFKQEFYHAHPTIYNFVNALINFQITTYVTMRSCSRPRQKSKKTNEKYEAINKQMEKLKDDPSYRFSFVSIVSAYNKQKAKK